MARNRVQFQPGLSMPEFIRRYGREAQCCKKALEAARWPGVFAARSAKRLATRALNTKGVTTGNAAAAVTTQR